MFSHRKSAPRTTARLIMKLKIVPTSTPNTSYTVFQKIPNTAPTAKAGGRLGMGLTTTATINPIKPNKAKGPHGLQYTLKFL